MTYEEFEQALAVFALGTRATLKQLKERHRRLVKRYHPDSGGSDPEQIRQINAAYQLLLGYCTNYRFSFTREEFYEQNPEERVREQFSSNGIWRG